MGADNVTVCYGLRFGLGDNVSDADLEPFELNADARMVAAAGVELESYFGRVTDGGEYFLLVGVILGSVGVEEESHVEIQDDNLTTRMTRTRELLVEAGLRGRPALHFQLEAQY